MCFEKVQRFLMASVITLGTLLVFYGNPLGFGVLGFVIFMVLLWGVVDFCPSLWMLEKLGLPSCSKNRR